MEQIDLQTIITIIGVAITGLIAILTLSFWLGRYHGKINYHEKSIDGMKIDLDDVKSDLVEVKTMVSVILEKLNWLEKLRQPIENMTHDDGTSYVSSNSPLSINQEGRKVSEKIGAEKIIDRLYKQLSKKIKESFLEEKTPNLYDIQKKCFEIGREIFSENLLLEKELTRIKEYAYFKGYKKIEGFYTIFSMILRDRFFQAEGYKTSDIDKDISVKEQLSEVRKKPD